MVPQKLDMDQHPNAGKEKSRKKVANWFNLRKQKLQCGNQMQTSGASK